MPPGTRRANRGGYVEHDDFEGLPVRQWRQEWITVAPPEQQEAQHQNDIWDIELIHGMPKDSHLLPPHTQELLRAARSGRLYKRPPPEEDDVDHEADQPEKTEKKEDDASTKGFSVKLWKQIPRNVEAPSVSHLAKRRKGIVTIASKTVEDKIPVQTVTRATVRRIDAAGNPYTEDVTLVDGQKVEGEIISTRVEAISTGQPEALPVVPQPARRRPPPPKRKKAGPGRGRRKMKLPLTAGTAQPAPAVTGADGTVVKTEGQENGAQANGDSSNTNQDSEMVDVDDGDDNDDDDDEGDDGEEGDEVDDDDSRYDQQQDSLLADESETRDRDMTDAMDVTPAIEPSEAKETPEPAVLDQMDIGEPEEQPAEKSAVESVEKKSTPPNPLTLAPPTAGLASGPSNLEGSPLKNVVLPSPTEPKVPVALSTELTEKTEIGDRLEEESMIAKPPSEIVGEAPDEALNRDIPAEPQPTLEEALLPPPPDQVGNISSPRASPKEAEGDDAVKEEIQPGEDALEKPSMSFQDSVMTDDSVKPDDSASVKMVDTAAPSELSEVATTTSADVVDPVVTTEPDEPVEPTVDTVEGEQSAPDAPDAPEAPEAPEAPAQPAVAAADEPDLLGGLMGELDKEAEKEASKTPKTESARGSAAAPENDLTEEKPEPEQVSESVQGMVPEPPPEPPAETTIDPAPENISETPVVPDPAERVSDSTPEIKPENTPQPEPVGEAEVKGETEKSPQVEPEPIETVAEKAPEESSEKPVEPSTTVAEDIKQATPPAEAGEAAKE